MCLRNPDDILALSRKESSEKDQEMVYALFIANKYWPCSIFY